MQDTAPGWAKGVLVRRSLSDSTDLAYFLTHAPVKTTMAKLVQVAGSRWAIEECFAQAKGECGLDHDEVRSWHAWQRHITLSMFALAVLAALRTRVLRQSSKKSLKKRVALRS
jgi:SRSO17 transposase